MARAEELAHDGRWILGLLIAWALAWALMSALWIRAIGSVYQANVARHEKFVQTVLAQERAMPTRERCLAEVSEGPAKKPLCDIVPTRQQVKDNTARTIALSEPSKLKLAVVALAPPSVLLAFGFVILLATKRLARRRPSSTTAA